MKKILCVLATAIALGSCTGEKKEQTMHSVLTTQPSVVGSSQTKQFSGQVKESANANLAFKTAGQILRIYVKEGQYVNQGQLLAQLDDKDYQLGVKAAQAQYNQLKNEVARLTKLYKNKSVSGNDYEKATAGLEQVGVNLENNMNKVKYTKLYAPQSGIIQSVNFEVMEMVNAGTPVFNILYTGGMEVEVSLPTSMYLQKSDIKTVQCRIGNKSYQAHLTSIVPKADNTQLYKATFAIERADKDVVSGMNADVSISLNADNLSAGLSLPANAVFEDGGKSYVWAVGKDSVVNRREVAVGSITDDGCIIITSGIGSQDQIVRAGVHTLQDKEKVRIIAKDSESNVGGML